MAAAPFPDRARVDARDKVCGRTAYTADRPFVGLLHGMTVPSRIAKGRLTGLSTDAAMRVPGVVRILTSNDFPAPRQTTGGGEPPPPVLDRTIRYRGQPVAFVVAETMEAAIEAAEAIRPAYATETFASVMESPGAGRKATEEVKFGNATSALAGAAAVIDASYASATQHHNPMELLATTAIWSGGRLTIHECSQGAGAVRSTLAQAMGLDPTIIDVYSPTIGGGFGQKDAQRHTPLVARAAMLTGRPVKFVMPRGQIYHVTVHRPASRHRIRLGADAAGKMVAARYDAEHEQSKTEQIFPADGYHEAGARMYGIENYLGTGTDIMLDRNLPGYMRGTYPQLACHAVESAVDELAYKLGRDPVALRLANDTRMDPKTGNPLSSRFLNECLQEGARRFDWPRRTPEPMSMTRPDGTQVGWGVASGIYPSNISPAIATLRVGADGATRFAISGHEMGQGMLTAITSALLQELDIDPDRLEIALGDTRAAPQHTTGGSWGTASVVPVAVEAAARMRAAVLELLAGRRIPGNLHRQLAGVRRPFLQVEVTRLAPGQNAEALEALRGSGHTNAGPEYPSFTSMSYSAHFVEVHVEPRTRRVRVPRVVSISDCGRVISPRTAASQAYGGVVWGISHALHEATEIDPRYGGYLNDDLADYVVPVNADIGEIDIGFVGQPDPMNNPVGLKGLGQVTMAGVSAAVANAVFHATGRRLRELPIRVEHLL